VLILERVILQRFGRVFIPAAGLTLGLVAAAERSPANVLTWVVALGALPTGVSSGVLFAELVKNGELGVIESAGVSLSTIIWRLWALVSVLFFSVLCVAIAAGQPISEAFAAGCVGIVGSLTTMTLAASTSLAWAKRDETGPWMAALGCCAAFYTLILVVYAFLQTHASRILGEGVFLLVALICSQLVFRFGRQHRS
jgi:hypothetical protein